jgi:tetratricopeptide (TPR) repeat protein
MGFAGNLSTLSLVEVFQTINRIRATGVLRLAATEAGRDVVFSEGEIIGVGFRAGEERLTLLRRLILEGRIDANTAASISSTQQDSSLVLATLIERRLIAEAEVQDALQRQAEDELYNLCTWEYADFVFQDATAEDPAATRQVEACRLRPLQLNVNSVLMESARRMDEWARLREVIKSQEAVLGAADGREQDLLAASQEFPGSAVIPLIDAVRTVEAIVKNSVATRLDVYGVLADLLNAGLVAVLGRDDVLSHAEYQFSQRDYIKAAQLFRRALNEVPTDQATTAKLADCLALLGESPEAAGCYSQLAIGQLEEGDIDEAILSAQRAVRLASNDPHQRLILVRCLLEAGKKTEAIAELRTVVTRFLELGQFEDARGTCLKILELDPTNEDARREMARIFANAERDAANEDVVVCIQCGHVNHREAKACSECAAPLRLACQSCQRTVAVSDRLCIFCGANPHSVSGKRKVMASPTTTRIVVKGAARQAAKDGKGSQFWATKLEAGVKQARTLEEAGDLSGALKEWREVAKVNQDNKELQNHIRDLETRLNDDIAEKLIERGHQLRRVRRFHAALKSYQSAIRSIPENDPRVPRLREILVSTRKHHQRILVIYAAAFVFIGVFGWLVARPYLLLHNFRNDLAVADRLLESVPPGTSPATFDGMREVAGEVERLEGEAKRLGGNNAANEARIALNEYRGRMIAVRMRVVETALQEITTATGNGDLVRAEQMLTQLRLPDFRDSVGVRLKTLETQVSEARRRLSDIETQRQQAPERLAQARAQEQAGALGQALGGYRQLAGIGHETASPVAQEGVSRLEPKEQAFAGAVAQAQALAASDLGKADAVLATLAPDAAAWGRAEEIQALRGELGKRIQEAALAYQRLGPTPTTDALAAFIALHPAAPQSGQARVRMDQLAQAERSRGEQVEAWRAAMTAGQIEQAWRIARNLFAGGGALPPDLRLPMRIESMPSGAQVTLGGNTVGTTPCVVALLPAQVSADLQLTLAGWQPLTRKVSEVTGEWRWQAALKRTPRWQAALGKPVNSLTALADGGVLALSGEVLHRLDREGKVRWRLPIAAVDELADPSRLRLAHQPVVQADGSLVLGLLGKDVVTIDAQGNAGARYGSSDPVRGRPQIYTNDLLGGLPRIAYAAEALFVGDLGQEPGRIPLPSPALSGPLTFPKGPDRVLVVATVQGQLVAFEESTRRRLWQSDFKAAEIGQLLPVGAETVLAVLDGSRVACWQIGATGATVRWSLALPGPAIGDPVVGREAAWIAAGSTLVRMTFDGVATSVPLAAPAATPAGHGGDLTVVGLRSGQIAVFRLGTPLWSSLCESAPAAVSCASDMVVVGMADGTVATYSP